MIPTKRVLLCTFLALLWVPWGTRPELSSSGVKNRPLAQTAVSEGISSVPILRERMYRRLRDFKPYVLAAADRYDIPPNVLMAILYEEGIHRKPVDISTFGPAQIGVGELVIQGLPPRVDLLEDDEIAVYVLAAKLKRLQMEYYSLKDAIILHNGYSDYHRMIQLRAKDPRIIEILESQFAPEVFEV